MVTAATLLESVTCVPAWFAGYLTISNKTIKSGYRVDGAGNVPADPKTLVAAAARALSNDTTLPPEIRARGARLTPAAYSLARNVSSEVGTSSIGDAVAVLQDTVNQAARRGHNDVVRLLISPQALGHANRGWYGPINVTVNGLTAPYGRWSSTSKDPTVRAIVLAQDVLDGVIPRNFNKGGANQANLTLFKNPAARIRLLANEGSYWTGHLPGADHRRSMHFAPVSDANTATAALLVTRAINALKEPSSSWTKTPVCDVAGQIVVGANGRPLTASAAGAITNHGALVGVGLAVFAATTAIGVAIVKHQWNDRSTERGA